ncbi:methyltransferase domain protein [mine drainage metagenome]|uniref:Methyltransferase domain protein n=1 Tax=mine drainage metagenome TaxID=410659 RepID=A0A1J5R517_9ZZZZ
MSVMRSLIDFSTATIGRLKRTRRINPAVDSRDGLVKVNLGCGLAVTQGWINVDASLNSLVASWPRVAHKLLYRLSGANRYYSLEQYCDLLGNHVFMHHDLSHSVPLKDQTVDFIYSSHFLEHLFKADADRLLTDCYRALKPGGIIRISIPDLAYAVSFYARGEKERMLADYFFVEDKESFLARHKYMYDFELLRNLLEKVGFSQIVRCAYQEGRTPDIKLLDNRPEDSLFVEAVKL